MIVSFFVYWNFSLNHKILALKRVTSDLLEIIQLINDRQDTRTQIPELRFVTT